MTAASADDTIRRQLEELGLAGSGAVHRNLPPAELIARSLARAEGILAANGALVVKTGEPSGPLAPRPRHRRGGRRRRAGLLGRHQPALQAGALRPPARQGARLPARPRPLRLRRLRRGRAHLPPPGARGGRRHLARALRDHALRAPDRDRARRLRPRLHGDRLRRPARQRRLRRHAQLGVRRHQLHPQARAHPRQHVRRRDQEGRLHGHELPDAAARRAPHALLGEHGRGRRRGALLRPLGHRQDDALRRSVAAPDRRRRARLERPQHLQLRGRLLRQDDPPLARGRSRRSTTPSSSARSSRT